jgi:hypothetical protein
LLPHQTILLIARLLVKPQGTELHPAERALCEIALLVFPIFFINVLYMFMVAQMLYPYRHLRRANKNATGVVTDLVREMTGFTSTVLTL